MQWVGPYQPHELRNRMAGADWVLVPSIWWENAPRDEKQAVLDIPSLRERLTDEDRGRALETTELAHPMREALLEVLFQSGADLLLLPIQDVFGWRDRINQPATVNHLNWTWRLPWPSDRLLDEPEAVAVAEQLREWTAKYSRE